MLFLTPGNLRRRTSSTPNTTALMGAGLSDGVIGAIKAWWIAWQEKLKPT
jgi:hypothetical protein